MRNIILEMTLPNSKNKYSASKTVIDQINKARIKVRGRPSKVEVEGELKRQTHAERELAADMKRVLKDAVT